MYPNDKIRSIGEEKNIMGSKRWGGPHARKRDGVVQGAHICI